MDDAEVVGVGEGVRHRDDVRQEREPRLALARRADRAGQRAAGDQLHRVERGPVRPAPDLVDRHDRRVLEVRGEHRLPLETGCGLLVVAQHFLDRDHPPCAPVARAQDASEAAPAVLGQDLVALALDHRQIDRARAAACARRARDGRRVRQGGPGARRTAPRRDLARLAARGGRDRRRVRLLAARRVHRLVERERWLRWLLLAHRPRLDGFPSEENRRRADSIRGGSPRRPSRPAPPLRSVPA